MTDEQIDKRLIKVIRIYLNERDMPPKVARELVYLNAKCRDRINEYLTVLKIA
jgi:hypothetical protein